MHIHSTRVRSSGQSGEVPWEQLRVKGLAQGQGVVALLKAKAPESCQWRCWVFQWKVLVLLLLGWSLLGSSLCDPGPRYPLGQPSPRWSVGQGCLTLMRNLQYLWLRNLYWGPINPHMCVVARVLLLLKPTISVAWGTFRFKLLSLHHNDSTTNPSKKAVSSQYNMRPIPLMCQQSAQK